MYINDNKMYGNLIRFDSNNIVLKIQVKPETEDVMLKTNLPRLDVGKIYAQINSGDVVEYFHNRSYSYTRFKAFIGISINNTAEIKPITPTVITSGIIIIGFSRATA